MCVCVCVCTQEPGPLVLVYMHKSKVLKSYRLHLNLRRTPHNNIQRTVHMKYSLSSSNRQWQWSLHYVMCLLSLHLEDTTTGHALWLALEVTAARAWIKSVCVCACAEVCVKTLCICVCTLDNAIPLKNVDKGANSKLCVQVWGTERYR